MIHDHANLENLDVGHFDTFTYYSHLKTKSKMSDFSIIKRFTHIGTYPSTIRNCGETTILNIFCTIFINIFSIARRFV